MSDSKRLSWRSDTGRPPPRCGRNSKTVFEGIAPSFRRFVGVGQSGARTWPRALRRLQAFARCTNRRSGSCSRATASWLRSSTAACNASPACSINSYLSVFTGAAENLARRACDLCVRARARHPSERDRTGPARDDAGAASICRRCCSPLRIRTVSCPGNSTPWSAICRSSATGRSSPTSAPVHRMAKAVAIIPVGHDFPPFSANKGGSIDGSKIFLLTFDLAFQIQEQLRALEAGARSPPASAKDPAARLQYVTLLKRLLRQWAIPPARQFNRLPSRARVVMCAGLVRRLAIQPRRPCGRRARATGLPPMTQLPGDQPHARGLRAAPDRPQPDVAAHRRPDRAARRRPYRLAGRHGALVSQHAEGAAASNSAASFSPTARKRGSGVRWRKRWTEAFPRSLYCPEDRAPSGPEASPPQILVPAGAFQVEQGISLKRGSDTGLRRLAEAGRARPGIRAVRFRPRRLTRVEFHARISDDSPAAIGDRIDRRAGAHVGSLWKPCSAPVRPGGSWLALKALPLALVWLGIARAEAPSFAANRVAALALLFRGGDRARSDRAGPACGRGGIRRRALRRGLCRAAALVSQRTLRTFSSSPPTHARAAALSA